MLLHETVSKLLTFIEERETRLLGWGFYDVSFRSDEMVDLLDTEASQELLGALHDLAEGGYTIETLLQEMAHANLLFDIDGLSFRSRFAEGVRLIANLRQMFKEADWSTGPRLVSDIKLQLIPRRYPRRDQTISECWEDIKKISWNLELQQAAFEALSHKADGNSLDFAYFQRAAFGHILSRYNEKGVSGSIVTAGTGSGKTKAFYVPAFLGLITELDPITPRFTKVLATYPRNVLLADQLREALSEAAKLQPVIERFQLRKPTFGALLGTTPEKSWFDLKNGHYYAEKNNWKRVNNGFVVPFLKSPISPDMDLVWRDEDRLSGSTALYRSGSTQSTPDVSDGTMVLTREDLKKNPPDLLFLSIEMLNREMGNPEWELTFGLGSTPNKPRLLLLDEVHAYEGMSGAQVAWVLRRWRYWARARNLHTVGLSATLKDAPNHLGAVTGIAATSIHEFTPSDHELTLQDAEYNLAIKGDPTSGSSLLSTTIQTGMLLARLLTPSHVPYATEGDLSGSSFFGRKVFGFTDNLDSLNRWFSDMNDAERKKRLARFRLSPQRRQPPLNVMPAVLAAMNQSGQIWELPRRIGHNLNQPLRVTRCSSQDPGANAGSDLIVASASLEVGFDDPEVGAMLHHKKPVSMSSFIQRKGRAGRRIGTRPWTITVLSDYGADRWTFQNAERLFQPDIERIQLPILNPYVLRIQAAYFLIDWLGHKIRRGSPFNYLAGKPSMDARGPAIQILNDFINLGSQWKQFRIDFAKLFGRPYGSFRSPSGDSDIDALLWNEPRPLILHVVPSMLRKLERNWRFGDPRLVDKYEEKGSGRPIPNFIPAATFSGIGGSDCELVFPPAEEKAPEPLGILRALNETCPGRVSKRYSLRVGEPGYWLAISAELVSTENALVLPTKKLFEDRILLGEARGIPVYQPFSMQVIHRPDEILDTSTAFWSWDTDFFVSGQGQPSPIHFSEPWNRLFEDPEIHLHRDFSGIEVTRFSNECRYELRFNTGKSRRGILKLGIDADEGDFQPEAVGFRVDADGLVFQIKRSILDSFKDERAESAARFRPDYFLSAMRNCEILDQYMNSFLLEWVWQVSLAMLSATALSNRCTLADAQKLLKGKRVKSARQVLDKIFQVRDIGSDESEESRLKQKILEQWENNVVVQRIEEFERFLWADLDDDYQEWVRARLLSTVAQAIKASASNQASEIGDDDVVVDTFTKDQVVTVFLTETSPGGVGQIEAIAFDIRRRPEKFAEGLHFSISHCPRKALDGNILQILSKAVCNREDDSFASAFMSVRSASGFHQMADAKIKLQQALLGEGLDASRETVVSLLARILRPGSSSLSDSFIYFLNRAWRKHEQKLGIAIDPRTFAYLCVQYRPVLRRLKILFKSLGEGNEPSGSQIFVLLQQFLFSGCIDSCPECLGVQSHFDSLPKPSRDLADHILGLRESVVDLDEVGAEWMVRIRQILVERRRVRLSISTARLREAISSIQALLADELEIGFLFLPVSISCIERKKDKWIVALQVKGHFVREDLNENSF